jgi:hypothetical protein
MMLGYVHGTTKIWRFWDFDRNLNGGAIECSNVIFSEDQNGFQTKNQMEDYDIQFPEESDDEQTGRRTANALIIEKANRGGDGAIDSNPISLLNEPDPISLEEAMASPHRSVWIDAMKGEWGSLLENLTFKFNGDGPASDAPSKAIGDGLPSNATLKAIGSRWVFRTKPNPDGSIKFTARSVIKGYEQVKGIDFNETYAPVSKLSTLRMLLTIAAQRNCKIDHMDVKSAFLNPAIDKDNVYMILLKGIEEIDPSLSGSTFRLRKALYGLKQAPKLCNDGALLLL